MSNTLERSGYLVVKLLGDVLAKLGLAEPIPPKPEPVPIPTTPPAPKPEPKGYYLKCVRKNTRDDRGNEVLGLSICPLGSDNPLSTLHTVSGQPGAQAFRTGRESKSGSMEPLPQGEYVVGEVEWASGTPGDYSKNWNAGLGPVWIAITPKFLTERSALGMHLDANRASAPGSAGCLTVTSLADLKTLVAWFDKYKPTLLVCDWGIAQADSPAKGMPKIDITSKDSPNFSDRGATISGLVVHNTDSTFDSAVSWLCNPAAEASAHLVIGRDGKVACLVGFDKKAWHAGNARVNATTIGIEVEAWDKAKGMTEIQEKVLIDWIKWFMQKYGFSSDRVITHRTIVSTDCPCWIFPTERDFSVWKEKNL